MIRSILSFINKLVLQSFKGKRDQYTGYFLLTRIKKTVGNIIECTNTTVTKTRIDISGKGNTISSCNNLIHESEIVINGTNNHLILKEGISLKKANIIIRGSNNTVEIKKGTTFGSVRIVNVGQNNTINIGNDCLFADHIEIWASDTHSIFNDKNEKINSEKPITINEKVWVGSRVIILKGVTIGEGSVIGMGTIVTKNIPPNTISVGTPNKVIKENVYWTNEY